MSPLGIVRGNQSRFSHVHVAMHVEDRWNLDFFWASRIWQKGVFITTYEGHDVNDSVGALERENLGDGNRDSVYQA